MLFDTIAGIGLNHSTKIIFYNIIEIAKYFLIFAKGTNKMKREYDTFIVCDSGKFWSWSMRIWVNDETTVPYLPEIEFQMAQRSDPSAKRIFKNTKKK